MKYKMQRKDYFIIIGSALFAIALTAAIVVLINH
jgi:hypothetical protein